MRGAHEGSDNEWDGASLYSGPTHDPVQGQARLYAQLHAESAALNARLRELTAQLLQELAPYEAVDVGPSLVLAHVEKPVQRRPITQKILRDAGIPADLLADILDATAPGGARTGQLRLMVKTAYDALKPPSKRAKLE